MTIVDTEAGDLPAVAALIIFVSMTATWSAIFCGA
ncbi:hypothetical protein V1281_002614 [Nitrobacteraceae bacterium AZCC 2161]